MNTIKSLEKKEALLVEEIEHAEFELSHIKEIFQGNGESKLEEKAVLYTKLAKLSQELMDTQIKMDNLYVEDHLEEIYKYF